MKPVISCTFSTLGAVALVLGGCAQSANSDTDAAAPPGAPPAAPELKASDTKTSDTKATVHAVDVGSVAPDFALADQNNKIHRLADYKGKTVVLAFYPADMTAGCSLEARNLTLALPEFEKRGVQLFGVSVQDVNSKKTFCDKEGIKYSLLADVEKKTSRDYGVLLPQGVAKRVSFVIGPDGKVVAVDREVRPASVAKDTLALVEKVQAETKATEGKTTSANNTGQFVTMDQAVAAFSLPNLDGKKVEVGDWEKQKATVIFFMSTKCPVSTVYYSRVTGLAKTYKEKGVRFIGINSNQEEPAPSVASHAKKQGFTFAVLKDTGNVVADRFNANVTPEVFVIDNTGVLRYHGRIDDNKDASAVKSRDLQNALDELLNGKAVTRKNAPAMGCAINRG